MPIAQFNIAEAISTLDDPVMADFINNTGRINALADGSPGFIWRFKDEISDNAYTIKAYDSEFILINMSVWESIDSLKRFVYESAHIEIFKRKKEWFKKLPKMHMVLWKVEPGHIPTIEEGKSRLKYLQDNGESPHAFTFRSKF